MKFSTADLTILRIRCQKCGQHTEKLVTLLVRKSAIPCVNCGARISLSTPTNKLLIAETAASCLKVGQALLKGLSLVETAPAAGADQDVTASSSGT
jgi:DNA-directed RNA polymerase subunit RPC12/RpoP